MLADVEEFYAFCDPGMSMAGSDLSPAAALAGLLEMVWGLIGFSGGCREGEPVPVRNPERELGGVAAGGGGAAGDARARARDQLRQGRHEAPRLALARRRPLRRLARLRRLLLRRPPQR